MAEAQNEFTRTSGEISSESSNLQGAGPSYGNVKQSFRHINQSLTWSWTITLP
ncbi:UNVERIFIED_CONTAM: hypothetical protein FKN15_017065 [Acipenser sinensis]